MSKALFWMAVLAIAPALGGCAAAGNLAAQGGPKVYGGTKVDMALISGDLGPDADPDEVRKIDGAAMSGAACCGLVDLPLSFVADTVMLPVTVPMSLTRSKVESRSAKKDVEERQRKDEEED
jgi:uncharacterized protein YceK